MAKHKHGTDGSLLLHEQAEALASQYKAIDTQNQNTISIQNQHLKKKGLKVKRYFQAPGF